ncbi:MAG: calcineurin-like phosphoesterase family protein [Candidatus Sumerlaeia bacterium]|nr:calcineurin-like phosphoesterase family protein [Candidatus Sumerlaeia bacterium]
MTSLKNHRNLSGACAFLLTTMLALPASLMAEGEIARGVVFHDVNGNGVMDEGEPPIQGVPVSNGIDVVLTDAEGKWELPVEGDTVIFMTKPSGYAINTNENKVPQFFYVHRPDGSPDLRYGGVAPTGPLPESINFALQEIDEPEDYKIVLFADPQPRNWEQMDYVLRTVVGQVRKNDSDAVFGMTLGDILYDDLSFFPHYIKGVANAGIPFFGIIGNHDIDFDSPTDEYAGETYINYYGPRTYSFNVGKVHFVGLDNIIYAGGTREQNGRYREGFRDSDMDWLERNLEHVPEDYLVVIATHGPIWMSNRQPGNQLAQNTDRLFDVLRDRERVLAINGHTHYNNHRTFTHEDGWHGDGHFHQANIATISGAWWGGPEGPTGVPFAPQRDGTPQGYVLLNIEGNEYTTRYRGLGLPKDKQMNIYLPHAIVEEEDGEPVSYKVVVNIFDGMMEGGEATLRLNDQPERTMDFAPQLDPVARALYTEDAPYRRNWVHPLTSFHMWETTLAPDDLVEGVNFIRVHYRDTMGREFRESKAFLHR